jgi:hypothetical protein
MTLPCAVYIPLSSIAATSASASVVRARGPTAASAAATIPTTRQAQVAGREGISPTSAMYDSGRNSSGGWSASPR